MKPAIEDRLFSLGCLLELIGVCFLGYLTTTAHWGYSLGVIGLIVVWLLICRIRVGRNRRRNLDVLRTAFATSTHALPQLKKDSSYGFPAFTLTFQSEAELRQAEESGCISAFKQAIQALYGHTGSKRNPFDADRAVWATYEGWQPRLNTHDQLHNGDADA